MAEEYNETLPVDTDDAKFEGVLANSGGLNAFVAKAGGDVRLQNGEYVADQVVVQSEDEGAGQHLAPIRNTLEGVIGRQTQMGSVSVVLARDTGSSTALDLSALTPVGGSFQALTVDATPGGVSLDELRLDTTAVLLTTGLAEMRVTFDGTAPTPSHGHILEPGDCRLLSRSAAALAKFIRTGSENGIVFATEYRPRSENVLERQTLALTVTNGSAYSPGDLLGNVSNVGFNTPPAAAGFGDYELRKAVVLDNDGENAELDIVFFDGAVAGDDHAVFDPSNSELQAACGVVHIKAGDYISFAHNSVACWTGSVPFQLTAGQPYLYFAVVCRGTPTYTSLEAITIRLIVERVQTPERYTAISP